MKGCLQFLHKGFDEFLIAILRGMEIVHHVTVGDGFVGLEKGFPVGTEEDNSVAWMGELGGEKFVDLCVLLPSWIGCLSTRKQTLLKEEKS